MVNVVFGKESHACRRATTAAFFACERGPRTPPFGDNDERRFDSTADAANSSITPRTNAAEMCPGRR